MIKTNDRNLITQHRSNVLPLFFNVYSTYIIRFARFIDEIKLFSKLFFINISAIHVYSIMLINFGVITICFIIFFDTVFFCIFMISDV